MLEKIKLIFSSVTDEMKSQPALLILCSIVLMIFSYGALIFLTTLFSEDWGFEQFGLLGDSFGWLTSLFSGLALAVAVLLLITQRREMSELRSAMQKQQFESTFFSMVKILKEITSSIEISANQRKYHPDIYAFMKEVESAEHYERISYKGTDAIKIIFCDYLLNQLYLFPSIESSNIEREADVYNHIDRTYFYFWDDPVGFNMHSKLAHYSRYLYRLLSFVDSADMSNRNPFYVKLIVAQLSDYELAFIFFNCLYSEGENFQIIVEKYNLLENMPKSILAGELEDGYSQDDIDKKLVQKKDFIYFTLIKKLEELNGVTQSP